MNADLQKQLAEMLAKLMDVTQDAAKWAGAQIPPLVQEKITFGRIDETVQLLLVIAGFVVTAILCRRCVRRLVESKYDDEVGWVFGTIGTGIGALVFFVGASFQIHTTAMAWFAPRLYIIEWLHGMVTK